MPMIKIVAMILVFLLFCFIVSVLVHQEEERQRRLELNEAFERITRTVSNLTQTFTTLTTTVSQTNKSFIEFGRAISDAFDEVKVHI